MTEFREMRRAKQAMTEEACREVLERNTSGVLSLLDENGYTYGVPLSYYVSDRTIYFHGSKIGAKIDAIRHHEKVSFTVIDRDEVLPDKYTTLYRSVIVFGKAYVVEDEKEIKQVLYALGKRYDPQGTEERLTDVISRHMEHTGIIALDIVHMTGKESK